jgi:aminoglycoside phosphotransferase family enzyme
MKPAEIRELRESLDSGQTELIETHISWVLLAGGYVFKIKRPVRFSFLDFSTLELRREDCQREVILNRRLTKDVYLGVVEIRKTEQGIMVAETGELLDYAVKMRRLPGERQMDLLLQKGLVTPRHVEQIAERLVAFHRSVEKPPVPPDPEAMFRDFSDLKKFDEALMSRHGKPGSRVVRQAVDVARDLLHRHAGRLRERHTLGFFVDGHGDLHSKNIFLLDKPVIFDCIEFNDHFRYVDVLDELAFFCLDLELFGAGALASHFLDHYLSMYPCLLTPEDTTLFHYFQLYRAGVKLKINLIRATGSDAYEDRGYRWENADRYFRRFQVYLNTISRQY